MRPTYADFSADPPRLGNATARYERCHAARDHLALDAGGSIELDFTLDGGDLPAQLTLEATALVSMLGPSLGHAPMDVAVNGRTLLAGYTVPGGAVPRDTAVAVPRDLLVPGVNTVRIASSAEARSALWLYRVTLDPENARGSARRAMAREAARDSVFAFRTERRASGSEVWQPAPRLLFHLDRGEEAVPAQLAWRDRDGAEAAVSFQSAMHAFHGHHRAADGTLAEYRGTLEGRWAFPEGLDGVAAHWFAAEEGWGGGWHRSAQLRLVIEDGGAPPERVSWRDRAGNSGSVALAPAVPGPEGRWEVTGLVDTVLASDEYREAGEVARNLVQEGVHGKWLAGRPTAWLEFILRRPALVRHYVLASADDWPERDPVDWVLRGSDDGLNWTILDVRRDQAFTGRHLARGFSFAGAEYRRYRLEIERNAGDGAVQLSRVRFFASAPPIDGFTGWYQRAGEGPIGYRGTAAAGPAEHPGADERGRPGDRQTVRAVSPLTGRLVQRPAQPMRAALPAQPVQPAVPAVPAQAGVPMQPAVPAVAAVPAVPAVEAVPAMEGIPAMEAVPAAETVPAMEAVPAEAAPVPVTAEQWRGYLAEYSADILRVAEEAELAEFSDRQRAAGWLGFDGADEERIAALEERLGTRLPPSLRSFLEVSDGWLHLSPFMWELRDTGDIGWFRDAAPGIWEIVRGDDDREEAAMMDRALLVSREADALYWLLDPGDAGEDGEWAAYVWASWYPGLGERFPSFAALVADERRSFEAVKGREGRGVHPEGADELVAEGRAHALRGDVDAAAAAFDRAVAKGSGAALYMRAVLDCFLEPRTAHHRLRNSVLSAPHAVAEVGLEQVRAEVVPLYLACSADEGYGAPWGYIDLLGDLLPPLAEPTGDEEADRLARVAAFTPPELPETRAFRYALDRARELAAKDDPDGAWSVIEAALPWWRTDAPHRIAPVVLLTDPVLRGLVTPRRARQIITTPRGEGRA